MPDLVPVRRALISVSDKTDLAPFARALTARGVEIISTGGTARALTEAGIEVTPISEVTGFPEILGGRVKTLHPGIHGALLALRDDPAHAAALVEHAITPIDLVCVNLYPFERTVADPGVEQREAIEHIDIGGPSMLRSAAKNFEYVAAVTTPGQYDQFVGALQEHSGATPRRLRAELAAGAFARTAEYDAAIAAYLGRRLGEPFPDTLRLSYIKSEDLRYGENPHQRGALYRDPASTGPTVVTAEQLHGKALSFNNIADASAALELAKDLSRVAPDRAGAAVIKHGNACGAAVAPAVLAAIDAALLGDPVAAFGGILAINRPVDAPVARRLCAEGVFLEVVIAPRFDADALAILRERSVALRVLSTGDRFGSPARKLDYRSIPGGMLVQDRDTSVASPRQWTHAAGPEPSPEAIADAAIVWTIVTHLKSNAVAIGARASPGVVALVGAGAGVVDRVSAARLAVAKAGARARAAIGASDAFFPFPDGAEALIEAGVSLLVHPGGSRRDNETFNLCAARGVACMTTGVRHFRH